MGRHLRILNLALALQWRHKLRFLLDCSVFVLVVFLLASVLFTTTALKEESSLLLADGPPLVVQRVTAGRHYWIPVERAGEIALIRGVESVTPRLWGYYFDPPVQATYTVMGIGETAPELAGSLEGGTHRLEEPWDCLVGIGIARARLVEEGDVIPVKGSDGALRVLRIRGVFAAGSELLTNDLVVLREAEWRILFSAPEGVATDLAVRVPNPSEVQTVAEKVLMLFPDSRPVTRDMVAKTYEALFGWRGSIVLLALVGTLSAFVILSWERASSISGDEARLLGILRGVGWEVSDILELKGWQGLSISFVSFLLGVLAAHLHVFRFGCALFAPVLRGWSVLFPDFNLQPSAEPGQLLAILLLTVAPYTLATLVPAWKAASTDPDQAMRR